MAEDEKPDVESPDNLAPEPMSESTTANIIVALCCIAVVALVFVLYLWGSNSFSRALKQSGHGEAGDGQEDGTPSDRVTAGEVYSVRTREQDPAVTTDTELTEQGVEKRRQVPPDALLCTVGNDLKANTVFPDDGLCDYTILEEMPVERAEDLAGPYAPELQHFVDAARNHRKTEYGVAFDSEDSDRMKEIMQDVSIKSHLNRLFDSRIFHYGYINTDPYLFDVNAMAQLLSILKIVASLLADKNSPERPAYTLLASTWSPKYDAVSAVDVASTFRRVFTPDIYISKAHLAENDSKFNHCAILPATFLEPPHTPDNEDVYFFSLVTALKHASDLDKLRNEGVGTTALYVSVGVYGRWYFDSADASGRVEEDTIGTPCLPRINAEQMASVATVCANLNYKDVRNSKVMDCKYVIDHTKRRRFIFDTAETLRRKLCISKSNTTGFVYGIIAARVEYSDSSNSCGQGRFPLLSSVKSILKYFNDPHVSAPDLRECVAP